VTNLAVPVLRQLLRYQASSGLEIREVGRRFAVAAAVVDIDCEHLFWATVTALQSSQRMMTEARLPGEEMCWYCRQHHLDQHKEFRDATAAAASLCHHPCDRRAQFLLPDSLHLCRYENFLPHHRISPSIRKQYWQNPSAWQRVRNEAEYLMVRIDLQKNAEEMTPAARDTGMKRRVRQ
jgi:hypothetical protein